ncbi:MAG: urease accessory UreF family protein [Pseudomonadota bacterium]
MSWFRVIWRFEGRVMGRTAALLTMLQTGDSAFPSGAFAFSNGLETLVAEGVVPAQIPLDGLLFDQIVPRWLEFDRFYLLAALQAKHVAAVDRDCHLHQSLPELAAASQRMGRALLTSHARIGTAQTAPYLAQLGPQAPGHAAVVQALVARALELGPEEAQAVAFHGLLTGFASAAVRLGKIGAISAQRILRRAIAHYAHGLAVPPAAPSAFAPIADIATQRRDSSAVNLFAT